MAHLARTDGDRRAVPQTNKIIESGWGWGRVVNVQRVSRNTASSVSFLVAPTRAVPPRAAWGPPSHKTVHSVRANKTVSLCRNDS